MSLAHKDVKNGIRGFIDAAFSITNGCTLNCVSNNNVRSYEKGAPYTGKKEAYEVRYKGENFEIRAYGPYNIESLKRIVEDDVFKNVGLYFVLKKRFREYKYGSYDDEYGFKYINKEELKKMCSQSSNSFHSDLSLQYIINTFTCQLNLYNFHAQFKIRKQKKLLRVFRRLMNYDFSYKTMNEALALSCIHELVIECLEIDIDAQKMCERYNISRNTYEVIHNCHMNMSIGLLKELCHSLERDMSNQSKSL